MAGVPASSLVTLNHFQQPGSVRNTVRVHEPQISCRIDPGTQCHYGHEEESHPGGCKCKPHPD